MKFSITGAFAYSEAVYVTVTEFEHPNDALTAVAILKENGAHIQEITGKHVKGKFPIGGEKIEDIVGRLITKGYVLEVPQ